MLEDITVMQSLLFQLHNVECKNGFVRSSQASLENVHAVVKHEVFAQRLVMFWEAMVYCWNMVSLGCLLTWKLSFPMKEPMK